MNITRHKYIDRLLPLVGKNVIKVLLGQRRVGKSFVLASLITILLEQGRIKPDTYLFINKEQAKRDHIKTADDLNTACEQYDTIFVDEVQDILDREKAIRNLRSLGKDVYITGSNAHLLSGELASYLSGRYIHLDVYPLDYKEFLSFYQLPHSKESFLTAMQYGGMPYLLQFGFTEQGMAYAKDVYATIVLKDIVARYKIRNVVFFEQLIKFLAKNIGSPFSALSVSNYLANQNIDISSRVIMEYISYANNALFLHSADTYDLIGKKIFERKQKQYFTDIGLRNCMFDYTFNDIGRILENVVFSNLIAHGYHVYTGEVQGKEIDFIAEKNSEKMYIQVCYLLASPETVQREFGVYATINNHRPKYVISMDDVAIKPDYQGVIHQSIYDFLLNLGQK